MVKKPPDDRMERFLSLLYEEHLEEASFLYEQRSALLYDPEMEWSAFQDPEVRYEAHLHAIVTGANHALRILGRHAFDDAGSLNVVIAILCRINHYDGLAKVLKRIDKKDDDKIKAAVDALYRDCSMAWVPRLITDFGSNPNVCPILIHLIGLKRYTAGFEYLSTLLDKPELIESLVFSLGRLGTSRASTWLRQILNHGQDNHKQQAAIALLRSGDSSVRDILSSQIENAWTHLPLGLCGSKKHSDLIMQCLKKKQVDEDSFIGLGLLGNSEAIDYLISSLENCDSREVNALVLELITGAGLFEEVFIPETPDEDALYKEEIQQIQDGKPLLNDDGSPAGSKITRISQNEMAWREWWHQSKHRFEKEKRYRSGEIYNPHNLLSHLGANSSLNRVRIWTHHELKIRYGIDFPFEMGMFVNEQAQAIYKQESYINDHSTHQNWDRGQWWFSGICEDTK